jgi:hypothetical protein
MIANEPVEILAPVSHERLLRPREFNKRRADAENAPSRERVDGDAEKFSSLRRGQQVRARVIGSLVMHRHDKNFLLPLQQSMNLQARSARGHVISCMKATMSLQMDRSDRTRKR